MEEDQGAVLAMLIVRSFRMENDNLLVRSVRI